MPSEVQTRYGSFLIEEAVKAGKIPPSRRPHYARLFAADPKGTAELLAKLAPTLPVGEAAGTAAPDGYPKEWLGAARRAVPGVVESDGSIPQHARVTIGGD